MKPPAAKANAPTPAKPTGASVKTSVKKTVKNTVSKTPEKANAGDRIAKVLARAGVASRREAERMIELGRVAVNGKLIDSPALNVGGHDKITVDGKPVAQPEPARLWLYYKPLGLVTSERDEKGRPTVFDHLPEDLPRVMSVGRLDLNSEGLLLLTNDGEIKRRLELPSTGWLRKYRVRVNGAVTDALLEPLRKGITVEGERFQPMAVTLDKVQGANAWLTIGIREGRNREIRRAINHIGLIVNRLIRTSYGPFKLGVMEPGTVEEIRPKIMRDQLGLTEVPEPESAPPPDRGKAAHSKAPDWEKYWPLGWETRRKAWCKIRHRFDPRGHWYEIWCKIWCTRQVWRKSTQQRSRNPNGRRAANWRAPPKWWHQGRAQGPLKVPRNTRGFTQALALIRRLR